LNTGKRTGSSKKDRTVTFAKLKRDAALLREHAAVVVVLNEAGWVIEVITRDPRAVGVVRLVVVLAPASRDGQTVSETVVFEIGFSRTRPYQQVERYRSGKVLDFFIKPRIRIRPLTYEEYQEVAPVLLRAMREMLFALRESWHTKEAWEAGPKRVAFERGIYFTVHRSDTHAYAHFLQEDLRFRQTDYFPHHASILRGFIFARVHRVHQMSAKQLARAPWVAQLVDHCASVRLPAIYVRAFREYFSPQEWDAFECVCVAMGIPLPPGDAQTRLVDRPYVRQLPSISGMYLVAKHDERSRHARNCLVVEAIFEKEYREHHEIPF